MGAYSEQLFHICRQIVCGDGPVHLYHPRCQVLLESKNMSGPIGAFFFGSQRRGGVHDNPSAGEFMKNTGSKSRQWLRGTKKGNCHGGELDNSGVNLYLSVIVRARADLSDCHRHYVQHSRCSISIQYVQVMHNKQL